MSMDRRSFLRAMIAAGVGATLDPEQLLWMPRVMITVPAPTVLGGQSLSFAVLDEVMRRTYSPHITRMLASESVILSYLKLHAPDTL